MHSLLQFVMQGTGVLTAQKHATAEMETEAVMVWRACVTVKQDLLDQAASRVCFYVLTSNSIYLTFLTVSYGVILQPQTFVYAIALLCDKPTQLSNV